MLIIKTCNARIVFYSSHRPLDLDNVYNQDQVKIIIKEGDTFDEIPDFDKVFDAQVRFCVVLVNLILFTFNDMPFV